MKTFTQGQLVGRQRAEFDRAAQLQRRVLQIQFGITFVGAASVFIDEPLASYFLSVIALVLAGAWAYVAWSGRVVRGQAERARRATLLIDGLGADISQSEMRSLWMGFRSAEHEGAIREDAGYYDAREGAGIPRLVEMLEETSFWSCNLMRTSARIMWMMSVVSAAIAIMLLLLAIIVVEGEALESAARLFCVLLILIVSAEVVGAALAYQASAGELSKMGPRIEAVRASGFKLPDVLMLLSDYNAAVEGAPMFVPGVYDQQKDRLNSLWKARTNA